MRFVIGPGAADVKDIPGIGMSVVMRGVAQPREASAAEYASLAADCDRWGLSQEAEMFRAKSRQLIIRELKETALAAAGIRAKSVG